ncbi:helix-turn-helix transcriptional regulator [Acrocarpospora catenulata]|uniref:helix-turn-helix transcriptional regulator n=1 Tax=Acrocarpospora catenulata TaxID=2836182 RepID=UPI001BDA0824|nr:WYL domain-containing protein [Acrocarpospora catenulata]
MDRREALVEELRTNGRLSAKELAERLDVSKRTIVRDIARLQAEGVPIRLDPGGYLLDPSDEVKRAIDRSLAGRRVLRIEYHDTKGGVTTREVEPSICLGGRGGYWYLVAWCRLREDVRVFRLDRITRATVTAERYPEPSQARMAELAAALPT